MPPTDIAVRGERALTRDPAAMAAGTVYAGTVEPLTRSLPEQIAARLAERILSGVYAPGQRIREEALAAEFAVSRGPAREALRMLEKDGLITILARRGAMVTKLTVDEVREIFEIRAVLNGLRDRSVAESAVAREQVLATLEDEVSRLARCARGTDGGDEYVETVLQINRVLNRATPNRRLSIYLTSLEQQTARYSRLGLSTPERRRQSVQRWQKLVKAIRTGDGAAAEQIARERVLESRDAAIRLLASRPDAPEIVPGTFFRDAKNSGAVPLGRPPMLQR